MKALKLVIVFVFCLNAFATKTILPKDVSWFPTLQQADILFFHVCGSENIQPTIRSLNRDFALGSEREGYLFTEMPGVGEYRATIKGYKLDEAKQMLTSRFEKAHLWYHSKNGLKDIGTPTKIDLLFKATVKDCYEDSVNSMGLKCRPGFEKRICCEEKFMGPVVYWGAHQEYILRYSPDPSVRLKVPRESKHRYCNFQSTIEVKGNQR